MLIEVKEEMPGVVSLTLNRPEKRNALNTKLMEQLCQEIDNRVDCRVILLKGKGPVFCAGMDLKEAQEKDTDVTLFLVGKLLTKLYETPCITIAAIHGAALAGGAGLLTACDLVVATDQARIGYPEVRRGLVAAQVMTLLRYQVAERHTAELLLTGEAISSKKALEMGLVNRVVPHEKLQEASLLLAHQVLQGAPQAIAKTKEWLRKLHPSRFEEDLKEAINYHQTVKQSHEAQEGMAAFIEKRKPSWMIE